MSEWLRIAREPHVVRRALAYAIVVGSILIAINHGDAILRGDVGRARLFRICLTVMVPYLVSTLSSVGAIRDLRGEDAAGAPRPGLSGRPATAGE